MRIDKENLDSRDARFQYGQPRSAFVSVGSRAVKQYMKSLKIYLDGQFVDEADAKISVFDHGLLYGDGIFEGIRIYHSRVFKLREHIERLYDSAKAILLTIPIKMEEMEKIVVDSCRINELHEGYIRLVVTRGFGDLGLNPKKCPKPTIFCIAKTIQLYPPEAYERGLKLVTVPTQRASFASLAPSVKSLNYLSSVMAIAEANVQGADEAILLNAQGYIAECSADNIFVIKKGKIFTPAISSGALGGITRRCIIDLAKAMGKQVEEVNLTRYDLHVADEVFITGTGAEVVPVSQIDGRTIGEGKSGALTQDLLKKFRELTKTEGVAIFV